MDISVTLISLLAMFLLGVPVAYALLSATFLYFILHGDNLLFVVQRFAEGVDSVSLLAIPFFIMASVFMNYSGITEKMLNLADICTRKFYGGLAKSNILLSTMMGGLSGSNIADAAMNSKILVPAMTKAGYPKAFSAALTATSSLITSTIPPGIAMIVYGYVNNVSIGRLFMAGVIPGVLMAIILLFYVDNQCKKNQYQPPVKISIQKKELYSGINSGLVALLLPVVIIGGIRVGAFTPTEAGAVAVLYALFVGFVIYRQMKISDLSKGMSETLISSVNVLLIIAASAGFAKLLTYEQIPQSISHFIFDNLDSKILFLLFANLVLLILGMFLEGNAILIVLSPLLAPVAAKFGVDPVHFGIIFIFNATIGTITPPLGTVMFTTSNIIGVRIIDFIKAVMPYWIILFMMLIIITYIPFVSLALPNWVFS